MSSRQKRPYSSTASELDISANSDNHTLYPVFKNKKKKKQKPKIKNQTQSKKQKTIEEGAEQIDTMDNNVETTASSAVKDTSKETSKTKEIFTKKSQYEINIEKQLCDISKKLSTLLSKDDTTFIKTVIRDTMNEMKESLLSSVTQRIEVLESDMHTQATHIDKLEKELDKKDKVIEEMKEKTKSLYERIKKDELCCDKEANEIGQYSRRNNVRIYGIQGDEKKQSSEIVTSKVIDKIKEKTGLALSVTDIDISHRLGQYKDGKHRPIIVKFVRRQTKIDLFKVSKKLKEHQIYVNEDLTKLNAEVLASCRVKDKSKIEKAWSFEGKIYVKYVQELNSTQLQFRQYQYWLNLPWPVKEHSTQAPGTGPKRTPTPVQVGPVTSSVPAMTAQTPTLMHTNVPAPPRNVQTLSYAAAAH